MQYTICLSIYAYKTNDQQPRLCKTEKMTLQCLDEYRMETFIATMEQDCHRPVSLEITPHLRSSDKFNSNPQPVSKVQPSSDWGRKIRICRLPQIVELNHTRADFIIRQ